MPKSKKPDEIVDLGLDLEEPEMMENTEVGAASLLSEQIPQMAAKLGFQDSILTALTRDLSFNDFMLEVLLGIMKPIRCEAGSIIEVNHEERTLFFRAAVGYRSDLIRGYVIPMGKGIAGHVADSRQPFIVANVMENKLHLRSISKAIGFDARNLIAFPLVVRGKCYGVLELLNRVGEPEFSASDIDLCTQLCASAVKAIEVRLMLAWTLQGKNRKEEAA
jgi:GAF domain-containing protein